MIRQCFLVDSGILFHHDSFEQFGLDPSTLYPEVKIRPPPVTHFSGNPPPKQRPVPLMSLDGTLRDIADFVSEEEEDLADALSPINDMLKISKTWWILECIPQKIRFQKDDDSWVRKLSYVYFIFNYLTRTPANISVQN